MFKGTGVALITPFNSDKSIDYNALEKLINYVLKNNVDYLVIQGTTGESPTLSKEEKKELFAKAIEFNNARVRLVAGMGGNDTAALVNEMKNFEFKNDYDAFLSVTPYYNKPNQAALIVHYSALAAASPLPIILYNVPGRTGISMQPATTLHLAKKFKNIIGIKEASGSMAACFELVQNKPEGFLVISGDDDLVMPQLAIGMDGVISVAAMAYPKSFTTMVNAGLKGNFIEARNIHYKILNATNLLFKEGNPAGIKAALHILNLCNNELRLPLIPVSAELYENIKTELYKICSQ